MSQLGRKAVFEGTAASGAKRTSAEAARYREVQPLLFRKKADGTRLGRPSTVADDAAKVRII